MGLKKTVGRLTGGADMMRPRLQVGWLLPAIFGVVAILIVIGAGKGVFNFGKKKVEGLMPSAQSNVSDLESQLGL
jgi:hypothetical protein